MTSARPDTRYLAVTTITTDLSQRLTDLTASAAAGYELNSARTALTGEGSGRCIELKCQINNASTGVLVDHNNGASYRIRVHAGGVVTLTNSGAFSMSITAPNVGAGNKDYVIAWSSEEVPTGGGFIRSEFLVYDVAGSALSWSTNESHSAVSASSTGTFTVGGVFTGGVLTLAYTPTIYSVRISSRFHTRVETREHFVAQTAAPSVIGVQACERIPFPAAALTSGNIAGPGYQAAAASMQVTRNRHRNLSPLVQWLIGEWEPPPSYANDMRDVGNPKHVWSIPAGYKGWNVGAGWQTRINMLSRVRVPEHVQHLRVEVQWATWETSEGLGMDLVELRAHTSNGRPRDANLVSTQTISRSTDDGTHGLGVREVFDPLYVQRDENGWTWIWLSARTDSGSGSGNATWSIRSLSIVPWLLPPDWADLPPIPLGP